MKLAPLITALLVAVGATVSAQWGDHLWAASTNGTIYRVGASGALLDTVASGASAPTGLAVSATGDVYVAMSASGQLFRTCANGNVHTLYATGTNPNRIAIDGNGNLWVTEGSAGTVYLYSSDGLLQTTVSPVGASAMESVAVTRNGDVWFTSSTNTLYQYTIAGALVRFIATGATDTTEIELDKNGFCWVVDSAPTGNVTQYDPSTGGTLTVISVTSVQDIAINTFDELYVLTNTHLHHYTSSGLALTSVVLPAGTHSGVTLDVNGDVWVVRNGNTLAKYDRFTLSPLATIVVAGATGLRVSGDASGYVQMNVADRSFADADADTYDNPTELVAGSDPTSALSTPATPRPVLSGVPRPGTSVFLSLRQASDALAGFAFAGSMGNAPANYIAVPNTQRVIPLENDPFYWFVSNNFWLFQNIGGFLDANGDAITRINVPNDPLLVGTTWYFAFVTLNNSNVIPITTISNNFPLTIQP